MLAKEKMNSSILDFCGFEMNINGGTKRNKNVFIF